MPLTIQFLMRQGGCCSGVGCQISTKVAPKIFSRSVDCLAHREEASGCQKDIQKVACLIQEEKNQNFFCHIQFPWILMLVSSIWPQNAGCGQCFFSGLRSQSIQANPARTDHDVWIMVMMRDSLRRRVEMVSRQSSSSG